MTLSPRGTANFKYQFEPVPDGTIRLKDRVARVASDASLQKFGDAMTLYSRYLLPFAMFGFLAASKVPIGATEVLYYTQITSPTTPALVRRINSDGTGDQSVPMDLPSPIYPTISRNGRFLLVTSTDPGRPFEISNNVYIEDLLTGALFRSTTYLDEYQIGDLSSDGDLGQLFGDPTVSKYSVHFPYHKALSPDGTRIVVMDLWKEASVSGPLSGTDVVSSSGRFPKVDVFNVASALPAGAYVYLSPQVRDGFNQGGDGVDWHPALNEVVATIASDISTTGTAGITSMEGTVLVVFSTTTIPSLIRKLTSPVGEIDLVGGNLFYFGVHDYAPAISPNGQQVAYVPCVATGNPIRLRALSLPVFDPPYQL